MHRYRTHTCGALRAEAIGSTVRLSGWCHRIRDHGGLLFIDLRDHYGLTQVVADPDSPAFKTAEKLRSEWVVRVDGRGLADSDIVLFPELCVTGYTCADLFGQTALLEAGARAALRIVSATAGRGQLVVVGLPVAVGNSLYNGAVVIGDGQVLGIVPKQFIPNYKEFYERRWFRSADGREPRAIEFGTGATQVPFGIDLLFQSGVPGALLAMAHP